jgi:hypothetical protein
MEENIKITNEIILETDENKTEINEIDSGNTGNLLYLIKNTTLMSL